MKILRVNSSLFHIKKYFSLIAIGFAAWLLAACGYPTPPGGGGLTPYVVVITPTSLPRTDRPARVSPTVAPTETPVVTVGIAATIPPNTLAPTPRYTPTLPVVGDQYTVQAGDTLYGICKRLGVSYEDMVDLNNIKDPNNLLVGQVLKIPPRASSVLNPTPTSKP